MQRHKEVLSIEHEHSPPCEATRKDTLGPTAVLQLSSAGHTPGHVDCPGCRSRSLIRSDENLADMTFPAAFEKWIAARLMDEHAKAETSVRYIADTSENTYREYSWAFEKFFRNLALKDIHDGHLRTYQDDRAVNRNGLWKKKCGQNRIHKEVGLLLRMLRAAHLWDDDLDEAFDQLPLQHSELQRALDPSEQVHWLNCCLRRPEWLWINQYSTLALETCASTIEIRMARMIDINTRHWTFRVGPEASKNKFRNRTIPLESDEVREAVEGLRKRAIDFGARHSEHYLFPFGGGSRRGDLDVTRPMTKFGLKDTWNKIRVYSGLEWLRPYDMRHSAITRMAEAGKPIAVIMAFAGHISPRMQQHYVSISMQVKREAAQDVWLKKPVQPSHFMPRYATA